MIYQVEVIERHRGVFEIEAESEEEAKGLAITDHYPEFEATESVRILSAK